MAMSKERYAQLRTEAEGLNSEEEPRSPYQDDLSEALDEIDNLRAALEYVDRTISGYPVTAEPRTTVLRALGKDGGGDG